MINNRITGRSGLESDVRKNNIEPETHGSVVLTDELHKWKQRSLLFVSSDGSRDMNINGAASGTPDGVHNGTDSALWTASIVVGLGTWTFDSTAQAHSGTKSIRAWNMRSGDQASIAKGSDLDFGSYASLSGWVYLERFTGASQQILMQFQDDGSAVGGSVNIGDYIDTSVSGSWQQFIVPKDDLGVNGFNVDELLVTVSYASGTRPRFYLDDIQVEEAGGVAYTAKPLQDCIFQYNRIELTIAGPLAGTVTNGTMPGLSYDKILGLSTLSAGLVLQRTEAGVAQLGINIKNLGVFLDSTFYIDTVFSDGTNTFLKLAVDLPLWITLNGPDHDKLTLTINDDLSTLLSFRGIVIGREYIPYEGE